MIPGVNLSEIIDGKTLEDHWKFYTVNVKYLSVLTHEEFCNEFPNASKKIEEACAILDKLEKLIKS